MLKKCELTYVDMIKGLNTKITECRIEIEALKEEQQIAREMGHSSRDIAEYDEWIQEQHQEIKRLHVMKIHLQEIYREVR